jgi:hypothetical protein
MLAAMGVLKVYSDWLIGIFFWGGGIILGVMGYGLLLFARRRIRRQ